MSLTVHTAQRHATSRAGCGKVALPLGGVSPEPEFELVWRVLVTRVARMRQ